MVSKMSHKFIYPHTFILFNVTGIIKKEPGKVISYQIISSTRCGLNKITESS